MKVKFLAISLILFLSALSFAEEKREGSGLSVGVESGFGDLLTYPDGFALWIKPNIEWEILSSGFSLSLGCIVPVSPSGDSVLEVGQNFSFAILDTELELSIGNINSLTLPTMGVGGFIYTGIGYNWAGLDVQFHYLSESIFGFYGVVFVPGVTFEINELELGLAFEIGFWTGEELISTIEPVLAISYAF